MTFSTILGQTVHSKALISVELNLEVILGFFEEVCEKLDDIDQKVNKFEDKYVNKADKQDVNSKIDAINKRLDEIEANCSSLSENANSTKSEMKKWMRDFSDKTEADIGKCLIDCRNIANHIAHEFQPDIPKNVATDIPNIDSLISENKSNQDQIDQLKKDLEKVKSSGFQGPSNINISDADLQAISDEINGRMNEEMNKLRESMEKYTDDQINSIFGRNDEQGKNLAVDIANAIKIANAAKEKADNLSSDMNNKFDKTNENINKLFTESSKAQSQLNNKLNDLGLSNTQLKDKVNDLQKLVDNFTKRIEEQNANAKQLRSLVIKDDGQIDIAPILKQLNINETKFALLDERMGAVEAKETVHPHIVDNLRERLNAFDQQVQDLTAKLGKFEADLLDMQSKIQKCEESNLKQDEEINNLSTDSEKLKASIENIKQIIERLNNRISKLNDQYNSIGSKIDDAISKQNSLKISQAKDQRFDTLLESLKNLENDHANTKQQLVAACEIVDQNSARIVALEQNSKGLSSSDINDIKNEISKLWSEMQKLTQIQNEFKDESFLPKVDLSSGSKTIVQRTTMVDRSGLPRINSSSSNNNNTQSPRADTSLKTEKQEGLLHQMKRILDSHTKSINQLDDSKADKNATQQLFEQFRIALSELNSRIGTLRKALVGKVDSSELNNILNQVIDNAENDETATGVEPVRCICCGRPRRNVTGALDDPTLAKRLGGPVSTRVLGDGDGQVCFVYGERGDMYYGRSGTGKPIFSKSPDSIV